MPLTERPGFLAERRTAVGGSDVHHLIDEPPYGCRRRLWYDKKGVPEDFPFTGNRHTRRGDGLEDQAVREYTLAVGLRTEKVHWRTCPGFTYMGVHADRLVKDPARGDGLLEVKVPTSRAWCQLKMEGPPAAAVLQAMWGMRVWELRWAHIWAFNADRWEGVKFDVAYDEEALKNLRHIAANFWTTLECDENPYKRFEPGDRRCRACPWRTRCQGLTHAQPDEDPNEEAQPAGRPVEKEDIWEEVCNLHASQKLMKDARAAYETAQAELLAKLVVPGTYLCSVGKAKLLRVKRKAYTAKVPESTYMRLSVELKDSLEDPIYGDDTTVE